MDQESKNQYSFTSAMYALSQEIIMEVCLIDLSYRGAVLSILSYRWIR